MRLGTGELLIVLAVVLLVFGPTKLPQFGDALGRGIRNFKKAADKDDDSIDVTPKQAEQSQLPTGAQTTQAQGAQQTKKASS
jgi:sec-independent protein translocase protein TatA